MRLSEQTKRPEIGTKLPDLDTMTKRLEIMMPLRHIYICKYPSVVHIYKTPTTWGYIFSKTVAMNSFCIANWVRRSGDSKSKIFFCPFYYYDKLKTE